MSIYPVSYCFKTYLPTQSGFDFERTVPTELVEVSSHALQPLHADAVVYSLAVEPAGKFVHHSDNIWSHICICN